MGGGGEGGEGGGRRRGRGVHLTTPQTFIHRRIGIYIHLQYIIFAFIIHCDAENFLKWTPFSMAYLNQYYVQHCLKIINIIFKH